MREHYAQNAIDGLAFGAWLRSGLVPDDLADLGRRLDAGSLQFKSNPNHDPANGRFTSGSGGTGAARGYDGMTARGVAKIRPVGGGGTDRNGRPVPELFPPDPYALHTPAEALAHYMDGSGEARNYYFNNVDTSQVKLTDFKEVAKLAAKREPDYTPSLMQRHSITADYWVSPKI